MPTLVKIPRTEQPDPSVLASLSLPDDSPMPQMPSAAPQVVLRDQDSAGSMAKLLAPQTPEVSLNPDPIAQQVGHAQNQLQRLQLKDQPYEWGKHGTGGKIAHVLSVAGNIAGDIFAPNIMARIPGTQLNRQAEEAGLKNDIDEGQKQISAQGLQDANTKHINAETPEVAPNAESTRNYQSSETAKNYDALAQGPSLASGYAHAVNQAIKEGRDPAQDPIVQHLSDAITGLQHQPADTRGIVTDLKVGGQEHNVLVDPTTGKQIADLGLKGEKPPVTNLNMVSPGDNSDMVKAISEYRMAPPNPRTAQGAMILRAVAAVNPNYDASQYESQVANRKYFTSGKGGSLINSLNTISQHLDDAEKNMPDNGSIPLLNKVKNTALSAIGEAPTKKWDIDADAIGGEWSKLVSSGVATEGEMNHIKNLLNNADSPKAQAQAIAEIRELTNGKLEGIKQQLGSGQLEVPARGISSLPAAAAETREYQGHNYQKGADGQWHLQQK